MAPKLLNELWKLFVWADDDAWDVILLSHIRMGDRETNCEKEEQMIQLDEK